MAGKKKMMEEEEEQDEWLQQTCEIRSLGMESRTKILVAEV